MQKIFQLKSNKKTGGGDFSPIGDGKVRMRMGYLPKRESGGGDGDGVKIDPRPGPNPRLGIHLYPHPRPHPRRGWGFFPDAGWGPGGGMESLPCCHL